MTVIADTSALYALQDFDDRAHSAAVKGWKDLLTGDHEIHLHHLILAEVWTLLQARLGFAAVDIFRRDQLPLMILHPVGEAMLSRGMTRCAVARKRSLSLCDCVSIEFAQEIGANSAFAFDRHFREAGLLLPGNPAWLG